MQQLFLFLFFILFITSTEAFVFSRRRRSPQPVRLDCEYSDWKTITSCSKECGPDGVKTQERTVVIKGRNGGIECDYTSLRKEISCNRFCLNEGRLVGGQCICPTGWRGECCKEDINECAETPPPCTQICENTPLGSYTCSCNPPDILETDNKSCKKIAACTTAPCEHRCMELATGGYECYCNSGYSLNDDKEKCDDIDECKGENECAFECVNTIGSYECKCDDGYYLNPDHRTCTDIDECKLGENDCKQICLNLEGSYECGCKPNFYLDTDNVTCVEKKMTTEEPPDNEASTCKEVDDNGNCLDMVDDNKTGFDKDDMYNIIIGVLLGVVFILFAVLAITCMRRGYRKLHPPKPPPIATIPRFHNPVYNAQIDDDNASGVYADPNYEELPDVISPEYMDMDPEEKARQQQQQCGGPSQGFAENDYDSNYQQNNYSARRSSGYMPLRNPDAGDTYEDINEVRPHVIRDGYISRGDVNTSTGFTHEEDDYVNQPPAYDNI